MKRRCQNKSIIYQIQVQLNLRLSHWQTITMDQLCSVMLLLSPRDISTKLTQIVASHNQLTLVIHHNQRSSLFLDVLVLQQG